MNKLLFTVFCAASLFGNQDVIAHGNTRVLIRNQATGPVKAGKVTITFKLEDTKTKKFLADTELNDVHTKKLHFIAYDPALMEFRHEHPTYHAGLWTVDVELPVNGNYWLWAQGELTSDGDEFAAQDRLEVQGGSLENALPASLGDVRTGNDDISSVSIPNTVFKAGKMVMIKLTLSRTDGTPSNITPFLGASAHVILVNQKGDELIHVHPMAGAKPHLLTLHTEFPDAVDYRMWVQFNDDAKLRTVPLSLSVKP